MKIISHIVTGLLVLLFCSTCKKYDEGGWVRLTRKHLFGGNDVGDSKTWKLKKYEVNGIDSTYLIKEGNTPGFYEYVFILQDKKFISFEAVCDYQKYQASVGTVGRELGITVAHRYLNKDDSSQCKIINGSNTCYRDIFIPDVSTNNRGWTIKRLIKSEFVVEKQVSHNYRITLTSK